ncbi:hypothetical protein BV898_13791 [Hypsibius exemplaris]|uniref:Uncharacterized protein n=1 Tax=Hypsibius exemplaris TaxID=2072580 RepID=A0A1W0W9R7_HYPEX|nr:hypothetical protein BV898_13791 [Hypsibius exemplaris]
MVADAAGAEQANMSKTIRCTLLGPPTPTDYLDHEMHFAYHEGILYLRIGEDVYEGLEDKDSSGLGTALQFVLSHNPGSDGRPDESVSDVAICATDYSFVPCGKFRKNTAAAFAGEKPGSQAQSESPVPDMIVPSATVDPPLETPALSQPEKELPVPTGAAASATVAESDRVMEAHSPVLMDVDSSSATKAPDVEPSSAESDLLIDTFLADMNKDYKIMED